MDKNKIYLGFDIGGTKIGIGLITADGKLLGSARVENRDTYPDDILPQLIDIANKMIADNGLKNSDITALGISCPGPADVANGIITKPTNNKHWNNVPIRQYMEDNLHIKSYFENDANAAALAEGFFGAGKNSENYVYLTMSTGIGSGIVTGGTLVRGAGFFGGEFGHTIIQKHGRLCACGLHGCYEAYCGGLAIANDLKQALKDSPDSMIVKCAGGLENIDMKALQEAVEAKDPFAMRYWDAMIDNNALAMGILVNTLNPDKIILGTFAWAAGDLFFEPLREKIKSYCWSDSLYSCKIVPSELRRDIGYYAGSAIALYFDTHK